MKPFWLHALVLCTLALAFVEWKEYGIFTLIRFALCAVFVRLSWGASRSDDARWVWVWGILAAAYNVKTVVKNALRKLLFVLIGLSIAFCIYAATKEVKPRQWTPPPNTSFAGPRGDGTRMRINFLSDKTALISYSDDENSYYEYILVRFKEAVFGTQLFGSLYKVSKGRSSFFGLEWISKGSNPVGTSWTVLEKYPNYSDRPFFGPIGDTYESVLYLTDESIQFLGTVMSKEQPNTYVIKMRLETLRMTD
jgi:hypothetical protein